MPGHTSHLSTLRHGILVLSTQAFYPIPRLSRFSPIHCDQCEIIEEIYRESIGAEERDSLQEPIEGQHHAPPVAVYACLPAARETLHQTKPRSHHQVSN